MKNDLQANQKSGRKRIQLWAWFSDRLIRAKRATSLTRPRKILSWAEKALAKRLEESQKV